MPYTKALPEWNSGGIKPPQSKLDNGWQVDEKPPAAWWNWFMYTSYQAMQELQQNAVHNEKLGANGGVATLGNDGKLTAAQLPAIGSEQITDGTIANAELASDVKVGSLASLTTMAKASVTGAINEVKQLIDTHSNDSTRHITAQERTTWNAAQLLALTSADGTPKSVVTNLNTATTLGLYIVGSSATGAPTTAVGLLYVWRRGTTHVLQDYWEISTNEKHHRTSIDNGATWTAWQKLANTDVATTSKNGLMSSSDKTALDNAQKVKLTQDDGTTKSMPGSDANLVTEPGFYVSSLGALNVPAQYGILTHIKRHAANFIQIFQNNSEGLTFIRAFNSGGWSTWKRLTDNSILGGILLGNKLVDTQTATFVGKVSGSTTVNPHELRRTSSTVLVTPAIGSNPPDTEIAKLSSIDNTLTSASTAVNNEMAQYQFSFNLIEHVQRTYGTIPGATTADKVAWLRLNVSKLTLNWHGYGSSPAGNKASVSAWDRNANGWGNTGSTTSATASKITRTSSGGAIDVNIDANGFAHFLAYADPSNGVTSSVLNTDYVELQVELSTSLKDNMKPVWIDATLQSGWVEFQTALKPQYSIGFDGYVTLKGGIKSGTLSTTAMTLPLGYRPTKSTYFLVPGDTNSKSFFRITVQQDGQVLVVHFGGTSNNDFVSLDGIRFPTN